MAQLVIKPLVVVVALVQQGQAQSVLWQE